MDAAHIIASLFNLGGVGILAAVLFYLMQQQRADYLEDRKRCDEQHQAHAATLATQSEALTEILKRLPPK